LGIYREEALEHLDSPEQLDTLLQVTESRRWVGLMGLCLLILVALGWAVLGRVPVLVDGAGVILSEGGIRGVFAPAEGWLEDFKLKAGDTLQAQEVVGRVVPFEGGPSQEIRCPLTGDVTEVLLNSGSPVGPEVALFNIADNTGPLRVMLFLTPAEGLQVKAGMKVQVFPAVSGQSQYGHLLGKVDSVARYPWSSAGLERIIENRSAVEYLVQQQKILPVTVSLDMKNGEYVWSGSQGVTQNPLYSGMLSHAKIVVAEQKPISLMFGSGR
jgi:hypothetical protein